MLACLPKVLISLGQGEPWLITAHFILHFNSGRISMGGGRDLTYTLVDLQYGICPYIITPRAPYIKMNGHLKHFTSVCGTCTYPLLWRTRQLYARLLFS